MKRRTFVRTVAAALAGSALSHRLQAAEKPGMATEFSDFTDYQARDYEVVDYQFFDLPGVPGLKFRGPRPRLEPGNYFSVLGGAQAMGVLVERPYPALLSEAIGLPALNLGLGGGSARSYLLRPEMIDYVNRGRFAVLQVMTARGEPNSRFEKTPAVTMLRDRRRGDVVTNIESWERLFQEERERLPLYVAQCRNAWVGAHLELIERIKVPILLFWFSPRPVDEKVNYQATTSRGVIGEFPQLVDRCSLEAIQPLCQGYAECFSKRNFDYEFVNRFTGEKGVVLDYRKLGNGSTIIDRRNRYYPSPEMHEDAVEPLRQGLAAMKLI